MADFGKTLDRSSPDPLGRAVGHHQLRVESFQFQELFFEAVVFGVRDLRIIQHVVAILVMTEDLAQFFDAFLIHSGRWFGRHGRFFLPWL